MLPLKKENKSCSNEVGHIIVVDGELSIMDLLGRDCTSAIELGHRYGDHPMLNPGGDTTSLVPSLVLTMFSTLLRATKGKEKNTINDTWN